MNKAIEIATINKFNNVQVGTFFFFNNLVLFNLQKLFQLVLVLFFNDKVNW